MIVGVRTKRVGLIVRFARRTSASGRRRARGSGESPGQPRARSGFRPRFPCDPVASRRPVACVHVVSSHLSQIHFNFTRRNAVFPFSFSLVLPSPSFPSSSISLPLPSSFVSFLLLLKANRLPCFSLSFLHNESKLGPKNTAIPLSVYRR